MLCATDSTDDTSIFHGDVATVQPFVALIESRPFLRDCIGRSMQCGLAIPVHSFSTLTELVDQRPEPVSSLVVLSLIEANSEAWANALGEISDCSSRRQIVILASTKNVELAKAVIRQGAKGYIPVTMGFELAVQAIRFVLVGGTYAPADFLLAAGPVGVPSPMPSKAANGLTSRELSVVTAIKQGKPNKIIAYDLNMCESTVKVHIRNIMKKLNVRSRTEVAMKA